MNSKIWYLWKRGNKRKSKFFLSGLGSFTKRIGRALGIETREKAETMKKVYERLGYPLEIGEIGIRVEDQEE